MGANDAKFYLTGYDPAILFGGDPSKEADSEIGAMGGKNQYNTEGSQAAYVKWKTDVDLRGVPDVDSFNQDLTLTACYKYVTKANPLVCLDPLEYELVSAGECNFDVQDLGTSQGAPIAVSNINLKTTGKKAYFEIHFQNKGKGIPFLPSKSLNNCFNSLSLSDINMIKLKTISVSGKPFTSNCQPSNEIRLINGKGFAVCEMEIAAESYYKGVMEIEIEYNYRDTLSKSITVINVDR